MNALEAIETIQAEKRQNHKVPSYALWPEIKLRCPHVRYDELRQLWREKKITFHKTLNSIAFETYEQARGKVQKDYRGDRT
jgi:ribosomal protein L39E